MMSENNNGKNILVGMTGGIHSTVCAYLLKKQGFRPIGISVVFFNDEVNLGPFEDVAIKDLNRVKKTCEFLDIPFYAVNASELFQDQVTDPLVGRVLSGQSFSPEIFYIKVLIEALLQKCSKFNTDLLALGLYAKVLKNQKTGSYELMVANDYHHDQSILLSSTDEGLLKNLLLPLAEIRETEVQKIGQLIKVPFEDVGPISKFNFRTDPRMPQFIDQFAPHDLKRPGNIYHYTLENSICEHPGIHHFYIGQNNLEISKEIKIDPELSIISIVPYKGSVYIDAPNKLKFQHVFISRFKYFGEFDFSKPIAGYAMTFKFETKKPCKIYFKNNGCVLVEFLNVEVGFLVPGEHMTFYSRALEKGKVLGGGIIEVAGVFEKDGYHSLPLKKDKNDEEVQVDPRYTLFDKLQF
jgi:tRNA-specific 2-thiouridylase